MRAKDLKYKTFSISGQISWSLYIYETGIEITCISAFILLSYIYLLLLANQKNEIYIYVYDY